MKLIVKQRGSSLFLTIPSQIAQAMGIKEDDVVEVEIKKSEVEE